MHELGTKRDQDPSLFDMFGCNPVNASHSKKYIDKLPESLKRVFNEDPPRGYKMPLDKNDHPELDTSEILEMGST